MQPGRDRSPYRHGRIGLGKKNTVIIRARNNIKIIGIIIRRCLIGTTCKAGKHRRRKSQCRISYFHKDTQPWVVSHITEKSPLSTRKIGDSSDLWAIRYAFSKTRMGRAGRNHTSPMLFCKLSNRVTMDIPLTSPSNLNSPSSFYTFPKVSQPKEREKNKNTRPVPTFPRQSRRREKFSGIASENFLLGLTPCKKFFTLGRWAWQPGTRC